MSDWSEVAALIVSKLTKEELNRLVVMMDGDAAYDLYVHLCEHDIKNFPEQYAHPGETEPRVER